MAAVRCPRLVGRDAELEVIRAALAATRHGRGATLAVIGEPGIGKSRIVAEIAHAAGAGPLVLLGRAIGDPPPAPCRPLVEALLGGLRSAGDVDLAGLGPFRPALGRLLPQFWEGPPAIDDSPVVLAEAVLRLLRDLARDRGAVLSLEDLHWADPESLSVIEYLADNSAGLPLLLVLTARDEPGPARTLVRRLVRRSSATLLDLSPLDDAAVLDMTTACLGGPPDGRLLALVRARAEGVPLLVEELLAAGHRAGDESVVPTTVAELTRLRLMALPEAARRCVRVAALLGQRFDAELLPAATGLDVAAVTDALRSAVDAQLLDAGGDGGVRFRHALTRDAVVAALLPPERADLARRALQALGTAHPGLPGPWCNLAAQLAATAGDDLRAAELLLDIGRRDLARGALGTAEVTLVRARQLAASSAARSADVDEALAEVLVLAGQPQRAADVTSRLVDALPALEQQPRRLAAAHLRLAGAWTVAGEWENADLQVGRARPLAHGHAELEARADLLDAQIALGRGDLDTAERLAGAFQTEVDRMSEAELTCEVLELRGRLARRHDLSAAAVFFDRARRIARARQLPVWHVRALHELGTIDALDSLRLELLHEARELALSTGALAVVADVDLHLAGTHLVRDEIDAAEQAIRRCADIARRLRLPLLPMAEVMQALALLDRDGEAAERLLGDVLARAPDDAAACAEAWHARATHALLVEDRSGARVAADHAMAHVRRASAATSLPALGRWVLLATLDGDEQALQEAASMPGALAARWTRGFLSYARAVDLGRHGHVEEAEATFATAEELMLRPVPMPEFRHMARRLVAEAALDDGWGRPGEWLREDLAHFQGAGADRVATACRSLLRRAGAPVPRRTAGPDVPPALRELGVTAREVEVLLLVSEGLTNRDIAGRLYLSPRTVEKHVERLLAKAGASDRSQLSTWVPPLRHTAAPVEGTEADRHERRSRPARAVRPLDPPGPSGVPAVRGRSA